MPLDRIAQLLWGDRGPRNAAGSLQTFVSVLRRRLVGDRAHARRLVVTEPEAYRFATELVRLDLDCFDELLERSARLPTRLARAALEQALGLVRGDVLEDEPYATWALDVRGSYQGRIIGARLDAADAALAERDVAAALAHAEATVGLDPLSERAHRSQMLALHALGRTHEALSRYRGFRMTLDEELGLEPSGETRALEAALIRQQPVEPLLPRPIRRAHVAGGSAAASPRLLGRATELETVEAAVRTALAGDAALIQIDGETGVGKTRLLDELAGGLRGRAVGRAACSERGRTCRTCRCAAALRDALAVWRRSTPPDCPRSGTLLPELTLGAARPGGRRGRPYSRRSSRSRPGHAPLVLVLDDLQWVDPQTIAALGYLRRRGAGLPLALVTAVRAKTLPPSTRCAGCDPTRSSASSR